MTAPNHIVGGYCFSGIVASLLGINILQDYRLLIVIGIASLIPDIDHTKSLIGKCVYPLAKYLNRHYGHRTITHSLMALGGSTLLVALIESLYLSDYQCTTVYFLAYSSHLLLDCITVQGCPLFYPFKRNSFVLPGNPELRLRTNNVKHESLALCLFSSSAIFMQPLVEDGFWTTYNTLFGTYKHVISEYHKADELLNLTFTSQLGSEIDTISGLLVSIDDNQFTLIDRKKKFKTYPVGDEILTDFIPVHTKMNYNFREGAFADITADSLMAFVHDCECTEIVVQATDDFTLIEGELEYTKSALQLAHANTLHIRPIIPASAIFQTSPAIATLQAQLSQLKATHEREWAIYQNALNDYNQLKSQMENATNHIRKELLMDEFSQAKLPKEPTAIDNKLQLLQSRITEHKKSDGQRYQKEVQRLKRPALLFSGTYTQLLINGKNI